MAEEADGQREAESGQGDPSSVFLSSPLPAEQGERTTGQHERIGPGLIGVSIRFGKAEDQNAKKGRDRTESVMNEEE
jgi:hypothetical protein